MDVIIGYATSALIKDEFLGPSMNMLTKLYIIDDLARKAQAMLVEWKIDDRTGVALVKIQWECDLKKKTADLVSVARFAVLFIETATASWAYIESNC